MNKLLSVFSEWTAAERGSRSTALKPLISLIGGVLGALLLAVAPWFKAPAWVVAILLALLVVLIGAFVWAFFWLARKNPDALRTESFILRRTAIEHRNFGDSIYGVIESRDMESRRLTKAEKGDET